MASAASPRKSETKRRRLPSSTKLNIIHFNDVYELERAPRFATVLKEARNYLNETHPDTDTLCLFSGDFLSPSPMSTVTRGEHMITLLNSFDIDVACIGNHEMDFGIEHATSILKKCNFPILNANMFVGDLPAEMTPESVYSPHYGIAMHRRCIRKLMCECKPFLTKVMPKSGIKVGIFSVSEDWTHLLPDSLDGCKVFDPIETAKTLNCLLRNAPYNCDFVILLTHSRMVNDIKLCESFRGEIGVDLVAGGHDHTDHSQLLNDDLVLLKSGSDFENLSVIEIDTKVDQIDMNSLPTVLSDLATQQYIYTVYNTGLRYRHNLFSFDFDSDIGKRIPIDATTETLRIQLSAEIEKNMAEEIGEIHCDLDCTKEGVRLKECNSGNLMADIIRAALRVDCVQINGGSLRYGGWIRGVDSTAGTSTSGEDEKEQGTEEEDPASSSIKKRSGMLSMKDIMRFVPFQDPVIVVKLKGKTIRKSLEHAVSGVPSLKGQFPQVSGLRFVYDPVSSKPYERLRDVWISRWVEPDPKTDTLHKKPDLTSADSASSSASSSSSSISDLDTNVWELLNDEEIYTFATRTYLFDGGDGFDFLSEEKVGEMVRNEEESWPMSFFFRNFMWYVQAINDLIKVIDDQDSSDVIGASSPVSSSSELSESKDALDGARISIDVERKIKKLGMKRSSSIKMGEGPLIKAAEMTISPLAESHDHLRSKLKPLRIAPPLKDYRIMTLEDYEEFKKKETEYTLGMSSDPLFNSSSHFISMDHRPQRKESLLKFGEKVLLTKAD